MTPTLYKPKEINYENAGIGFLSDCVSCVVTEEENGQYEAELEFPTNAKYANYLQEYGYQIKTKPNDEDDYMIFDIYDHFMDVFTKTLIVKAKTRTNRLGRRAIGNVVLSNKTGEEAVKMLENGMDAASDIRLYSDIQTRSSTVFEVTNPLNCIGGSQGSLLQLWGGEIKHEPFKLSLLKRRGRDNVTTIRYGKNLEGLTVDFNYEGLLTRILPYADLQNDQGVTERIYGNRVDSKYIGNYEGEIFSRYIQFTEDQGVTDSASLNKVAKTYFTSMNPGVDKPSCQLKVNIRKLEENSKTSKFAKFRKLSLCDTFTVIHEKSKVDITAKVRSIKYDSLLEKVIEISAGDERFTFFEDQIKKLEETLKTMPTKQYASSFVDYITDLINGVDGGSVYQYPKNRPYATYYLDTDSIETAKDVVVLNSKGIGFSRKGWKGPFDYGWTIDGIMNANFIKAGILEGILIRSVNSNKTGKIELNNGHLDFFDFSTGEFYGRVTPSSSSDGGGISIVMEKGKYFSLHDGYGTPILEIPHNSNQQKPLLTTLGTHTHKGDLHIEGKLFLNGKEITGNGSGGGGGGIGGGYPPEVTSKADKFAWDLWTYLLSKGYSKAAAAGILGNVQQETGHTMDPDTLQGGVGPGYGLVQWDGSAYPLVGSPTSDGIQYVKNLMKAANITDGHSSILGQSKLIDWCMYNGQWLGIVDPTSVDGFKNMTDPRQAANTFERNFERPAVAHPERQGWAQEWYDKFKDLKPSTELGKVGLERLESLVMRRHGNGQCYAVPAEYSGVLGGCGLGAGTAYPLSHNIGDTEAAAEIGSGYDWGAVGWKVIFNPSYDQLVTGAIINWKRGGNIGGFNVDYEFGHTGVIRGLANGGFQTYEQNIGLGQVVGKYERSWVGSSEISSIVIPPK